MTREQALELASSMLGEKRLLHSLCVAEAARRLAPAFGADAGKAELAGILHDVMKEQDDEVLLRYLSVPPDTGVEDPKDLHPLWHAWAGAEYAQRELGLDGEICGAIRFHTSGRPGMGPLEKTLFLADYISDDRTFPGSAEVREKAEEDPEGAILLALRNEIGHLVSKGRAVDLHSAAAYDWFLTTLSKRDDDKQEN